MATTHEKKINSYEFAKIVEQLSIRYIPELDPRHLENSVPRKKRTHNSLDMLIDTQDKIKQFIILDILKKNNQKDLQKAFDFYVKTLKICINQNDFQSTSTILEALKSPPILRLTKEKSVIKNKSLAIENACINTSIQQEKILSNAELLLNPNEHFQQYQDKAQSLQSTKQYFVPLIAAIHVDLIDKKIEENLKYYKEFANKKLNNDIQSHSLYQLISNATRIKKKEFDRLTDKRSKDILPSGTNVLAFQNTQPFEHFMEKERKTNILYNEFIFVSKTPNTKDKFNANNENFSSQKIVDIKKRYSLMDRIDSLENQVSLTEILAKKARYIKNSTQWRKTKEIKNTINKVVNFNNNKIKEKKEIKISPFDPIIASMLSEASKKNLYIHSLDKISFDMTKKEIENLLNSGIPFKDKQDGLKIFLASIPDSIQKLASYKDFHLLATEMLNTQNPLHQTSNPRNKNKLLYHFSEEFQENIKTANTEKLIQSTVEPKISSSKKNKR